MQLFIYQFANPVEMTDREKSNINNKLSCARHYNDITEYFSENDCENGSNDEGRDAAVIQTGIYKIKYQACLSPRDSDDMCPRVCKK